MQKNIGTTLKIFAIITLLTTGIFAQRSLMDGYWQLTQLNGTRIVDSKAFLGFDSEGKIYGNGGCNKLFGSYARKGTSMKFSNIGTTRMACGLLGVMKDERTYIEALKSATRYSLSRNTLSIFSGKKLVLKFTKTYPTITEADPDNPDLEEKKWVLDSGDKSESAFISFDREKGSAGGNSGCNSYGGTYVTKGNTISITEVISTMMACMEGDRMKNEQVFFEGLRNANKFEIKEGKLILYKVDKVLLRFKPMDK